MTKDGLEQDMQIYRVPTSCIHIKNPYIKKKVRPVRQLLNISIALVRDSRTYAGPNQPSK